MRVTSPKAICSRPVAIGAWWRVLEQAATCESSRNLFFGSQRENNAVPARVDLYKFYLRVLAAGCSAVAMAVTSVSNGEKCLFAESVAAAVRVLVSQRPNDQLWHGEGRHLRRDRARTQNAQPTHNTWRPRKRLWKLHLQCFKHGASINLCFRLWR